MKLEPFRMERMQSVWENQVEINLSESGVHPMRVAELETEVNEVLLGYPQSNGPAQLRDLIALRYPGSTPDQVLVATGTAEANFICAWNLVEPGDRAIVVQPNYMQIPGVLRTIGAEVVPLWLRPQGGSGVPGRRWAPDLDALVDRVTDRTRLIAVCNPNNPTGAVLSEDEMHALCEAASRVGAWVVADEVYRGAELDGSTSPTFHGRYERLLVTSGLSKAYGLPGLRIGWVVGPPSKVEQLWGYKDYTTIGPGAVSVRLAEAALQPERHERILARTRGILRARLPVIESWIDTRDDVSMIPPLAGAIAYLQYDPGIGSIELCERLRREQDVLIVPGEHFEMEHHLRIGFGGPEGELREGLRRIGRLLTEVRAGSSAAG